MPRTRTRTQRIETPPSARRTGSNPRALPGEDATADLVLRQRGRAAVEPLVEVELEPLLEEAELFEPGAREHVDELPRSGSDVGAVPGALDLLVPAGALRLGIGRVVGRDHDAARRDERDQGADEREGILDVVDDEARDRGVERASAQVEDGALVEARMPAEPLAALPRAPHHLRRQIDTVHRMTRGEERLRDEPGAAARVEQPRPG